MFKKLAVSVATIGLLVGCGTSAKRLAEISPGMTKTEVISVLGSPESVSGQGSEEVFIYTLSNSWNSPVWNEKYQVYFYNGRVVRFGQ